MGLAVLPRGEISADLANRLAERGGEDGRACSQYVHPRARLLPAGQSGFRRLSARLDHRGFRSRARRQTAAIASPSSTPSASAGSCPMTSGVSPRTACSGSRRRWSRRCADEFSELVPGNSICGARAGGRSIGWSLNSEREIAFKHSEANGPNWKSGWRFRAALLTRQILGLRGADKAGREADGRDRRTDPERCRSGRSKFIPCGVAGARARRIGQIDARHRAHSNLPGGPGSAALSRRMHVALRSRQPRGSNYVVRKKLFSPWSIKNQDEGKLAAMRARPNTGRSITRPAIRSASGKTFAIMHRHAGGA